MELSGIWTCSCGADNAGDVFTDPCWKCGTGGAPVKIERAEDLQMCPACKATDGFHKINCPTHPVPKEWIKKP